MSRYCASSLDSIPARPPTRVRAGQGRHLHRRGGWRWVSRYNERTEPAGLPDQKRESCKARTGTPNAYIDMGLTAVKRGQALRGEAAPDHGQVRAAFPGAGPVRSQEDGFFDREIVPVKLPDGSEVTKGRWPSRQARPWRSSRSCPRPLTAGGGRDRRQLVPASMTGRRRCWSCRRTAQRSSA